MWCYSTVIWCYSKGCCSTRAIWHCHKPFSQWQGSFQMKAASPLAERLTTASVLQFPPMLFQIPCLPQSIMPCLYSCISYPLWVINARAQPASLPHSSSNRYCYYWWGMHILTTGSRYCYWMRGICTYWPIISHWGGWKYYTAGNVAMLSNCRKLATLWCFLHCMP